MMPNVSDPENEFEKRGVTFKIITDDMCLQVLNQYMKNDKTIDHL